MTYSNTFIVYVDDPKIRNTLAKHGKPGKPTALQSVIIFKTDLSKSEVEAIPGVVEVEEDGVNEPDETQTQSRPRSWFLPSASDTEPDYVYRKTGQGVAIYVMDSGIRLDHDEFKGRDVETVYSFDGADYGGDVPSPDHGMMAASCAAGNEHGIAKSATVYNLRYNFSFSDGVKCLDTMLAHFRTHNMPAILSMSFSSASNIYNHIFTELTDAGVVLVASAGNQGLPNPRWPARREDVIAVAAANRNLEPSVWGSQSTNYGPEVDIWAGGSSGRAGSIDSETAIQSASGTSSACPLVAGNIALLMEDLDTRPSSYSDVMNVKRDLIDSSRKGVIRYTDEKYLDTPNRYIYTLAEERTPDADPVPIVRPAPKLSDQITLPRLVWGALILVMILALVL